MAINTRSLSRRQLEQHVECPVWRDPESEQPAVESEQQFGLPFRLTLLRSAYFTEQATYNKDKEPCPLLLERSKKYKRLPATSVALYGERCW